MTLFEKSLAELNNLLIPDTYGGTGGLSSWGLAWAGLTEGDNTLKKPFKTLDLLNLLS